MDSTADHLHHHQAGQMNLLPNGVAHNDNSMGMMMGDIKQFESAHHMNNPHDGNHGEHMSHGDDGMSMMKMYFHSGLGDMVLFKDLIMDSNTKLILTCIVLFLCGVLLELIDYSRGYLSCRCRAISESLNQYKSSSTSESHLVTDQHQQTRNGGSQDQNWSCCSGSRTLNQETENEQLASRQAKKHRSNPYKAQFFPVRSLDSHGYRSLQAGLQFIRTGLSLALMLVAMTYNICLIFPILLGSAVGFYIFYRPALDSKSVVCH